MTAKRESFHQQMVPALARLGYEARAEETGGGVVEVVITNSNGPSF
jgi:hypothetical protein